MENTNKKVEKENLEQVTGGGWWSSYPMYESEDTPRFRVGEVVGGKYKIAAINATKSGLINKEFTYKLVYLDNPDKVYDDTAYESQLISLNRPF